MPTERRNTLNAIAAEAIRTNVAEPEPSPKLRVWHVPQVPMKAFHVPVASIREARLVLDVLAYYDVFQFENRIKPDYCNAGGLQVFNPKDDTDSPDGSWYEWYDDEDNDINHDKYDRRHSPWPMSSEEPANG